MILPLINLIYSEYLTNPDNLPSDWKIFFDGLRDNQNIILDRKILSDIAVYDSSTFEKIVHLALK